MEGEVEGECEAEEVCEDTEEGEASGGCPAVIVEEMPGTCLTEEQEYSAQVLVYADETDVMQEVETEGERGENPLDVQNFHLLLRRHLK